MRTQRTSIEDLYLFLLLFVAPFIDAINGFLILKYNGIDKFGSLGQIHRGILLLLALFLLFRRKSIFMVIPFSLYLITIELLAFAFHGNTNGFLIGIAYSSKLIYIFTTYLILGKIVAGKGQAKSLLLFRQSGIIYAILLFLGIITGYANSTYRVGALASKGTFASGNGLSIYLGAMTVLSFFFFTLTKKRIDFAWLCIMLLSTTLVGTKASIVFLALTILMFIAWLKPNHKALLISFLGLIVSLNYEFIVTQLSKVFQTIIDRYSSSNNLLSFLASGREYYIRSAFDKLDITGFNLLRVIFGFGTFVSFRSPGDMSLIYDTLETDFFDLFFSYGVVGLLIYVFIFLKGVLHAFAQRKTYLLAVFIPVYMYSAIAGHVVFNAMSVMPLIFSMILIEDRDRGINEKK